MLEKKQIEEMSEEIASMLCEAYRPNCDEYQPHTCSYCYVNSTPIGCFAEMLYNAGYRKQSDLIEEFADRLKKKLYDKQSIFTQQRYIVVDEIENLVSEMKGGAE